MSLSCMGLVVPGRARLHSNLSTHARLNLRILSILHIFIICSFTLDLRSYPSRFSDVFYVDTSTKETISAGLVNIAFAKGIGKLEKTTLDWLSRHREEWLLMLDNMDDPTLNLCLYLPCCSHGNILITSRNCDTCVHAPQFCHILNMRPEDVRWGDLLLKVACLEQNNENEALATMIVKVHVLCSSGRSIQ